MTAVNNTPIQEELLHIVAYQTEIALNLGSMIRTCACLNLPIHVVEPCGFPFSIKSVRRSAMDYANIADIRHHLSWSDFRDNRSGRTILLTTKAETNYSNFRFQTNDHLVLGQESAGVPISVREDCDQEVTIQMPGGGRSLNVGVAMAIVAAEALRQIQQMQIELGQFET